MIHIKTHTAGLHSKASLIKKNTEKQGKTQTHCKNVRDTSEMKTMMMITLRRWSSNHNDDDVGKKEMKVFSLTILLAAYFHVD